MGKFCFPQLASCLDPKSLRFIIAIALFGFLFLFFVPNIYDATMFQCEGQGGLCPTNPAGLKSIGYALFHWGGVYAFGDSQLSGYGFVPPGNFAYADGSIPTTSAILFFFALPLAIAGAAMLEPEIVRMFRHAVIGFLVLGILAFIVAANSFALAYHGLGLAFDLLGVGMSLTALAMILYLYDAGWFIRTVQPNPDRARDSSK